MNTETSLLWGGTRTRVAGTELEGLLVSAYLPENLDDYPEKDDVLYRVTMRPSWNWAGVDVHFYVTEYKILGETPCYWKLEIDGETRLRAKDARRQFAHKNIRDAVRSCMHRARHHEMHCKTRYDEARARHAAAKRLVEELNDA